MPEILGSFLTNTQSPIRVTMKFHVLGQVMDGAAISEIRSPSLPMTYNFDSKSAVVVVSHLEDETKRNILFSLDKGLDILTWG